jgi:hypothetical protein
LGTLLVPLVVNMSLRHVLRVAGRIVLPVSRYSLHWTDALAGLGATSELTVGLFAFGPYPERPVVAADGLIEGVGVGSYGGG